MTEPDRYVPPHDIPVREHDGWVKVEPVQIYTHDGVRCVLMRLDPDRIHEGLT